MQNSMNSFIDYFKLFKVFELKKIEKTGLVKIIQDKILNRKIISVQGNISTSNFVTFQTHNFPNMPFSERYLYMQAFIDAGKAFCLQVAYTIGNRPFKAVFSTLYKNAKKHLESIVHLPINLPQGKWAIAVIDLYELGMHFGFKSQEMKMIFRVTSIEIRASSKVKGIFQSDYLCSVDKLPKDMCFPLKKQESYFDKYHYFVETTDPAGLKYATQFKDVIQKEMEVKKMAKEKNQSVDRIKQNKSVEGQKTLAVSRSKRSLQKGAEKQEGKSEAVKTVGNNAKKSSSHLPPIRKKQEKVTKQAPKEEEMEDNQIEQQQFQAPKPQAMINFTLSAVEGFSLNNGNLMSIQSYLCKPCFMPTHKPIQILASCDQSNIRVVTAYDDGSICIWDTIRKIPLAYFMTELSQLKIILVDSKLNLVLVGLDKLKRQVINIISDSSVVFRQISTFNITGALLVSKKSYEFGLITFGFENVRLWRVNPEKSIIQGINIYLGQTNRKVKYTTGIAIQTRQDCLAYIADSNGFLTTVSVAQSKMLQSVKIDTCGIDQMILLHDDRSILSNQQGVIKIVDLERMQVQEEYSLNSRIKDIKQLQSQEIVLTHFNKSIGLLNLQTSMYSFIMRSHTSTITKIAYNPFLNKVISISKDNTIRIWQYVVQNEGPFQFRLQEQYQFVITGQEMVDIACGVQGKAEDMKKVIVGGDSGKLRIINIEKYCIEQEVIIETGQMCLSASRNGKYIICSYSSGNSYLLDSNLTILYKYLGQDVQKKKMKHLCNGFNRINKEYFIENVEEEKLEFYALKEQNQALFTIKFAQKIATEVSFNGSKVFILSENELKVYEKGTMMQMLNLTSSSAKNNPKICFCLDFPLLCYAMGEKIVIKVVNAPLEEQIEVPEPLNGIFINYNQSKQDGLIICSGKHSYSLYVFSFQLHNVGNNLTQQLIVQPISQQEEQEVNQMEVSFSNQTTVSGYVQRKEGSSRKDARQRKLEQAPKELRKLYQQQQELYEEVKQYLFPKSMTQNPNAKQQQSDQQIQEQQQQQSKELSIMLNYGYQLKQNSKDENQIGKFHWLSENNSLLLLTGCNKSIMQHFFSVPVKHKIINFPSAITSLCVSERSYEGLRYLAVCINGLIKIYNVCQEISFIRNIDTLSSTFNGSVIFQSCITNCNRYILTLSFNNINFDSKLYIHVIQISTGNAVSSSYLSLPAPKNKYKPNQAKQAKEYRMIINPFKNSLEFVIFNPQGQLYFYRITSILTLQTMQLEELVALCRDKISSISCGCFISVGESSFEDAVLSIGTENGSLVFVDCRTASIMIACIGVLPSPILSISYSKSHDQQYQKLILFTNSTLITVFNLTQGLNSILIAIDETTKSSVSTGEIKKVMTLDGEVTSKSNMEPNGQQIVVTKTGSLWLLDYQDFVTVKVSSVHTLPINHAEILVGSNKEAFMLTCSDDGSAKFSNLLNLQQIFQIYKPRKAAKAICTQGNLTLISFSDQVYIYNKIDANSINEECQLSSLGSFKLDSTVICLQNIPSTDNYYILTENEVIIIYIGMRPLKNTKRDLTIKSGSFLSSQLKSSFIKNMEVNVQIKKITDIQNPFTLVVNSLYAPYDQLALVSRPGKVTIWSRKCLKRNYNPIDELTNVHQLSYYLIDSNSKSTVDTSFVKFISQSQYLWGLYQQGLVQIRNFRDHSLTREINTSIQRITTMSCIGEEQFTFYLGDQNGYLYIINENGLLLDRIKALECKISGISFWKHGPSNKILIYGSKYAVTINNIDPK